MKNAHSAHGVKCTLSHQVSLLYISFVKIEYIAMK